MLSTLNIDHLVISIDHLVISFDHLIILLDIEVFLTTKWTENNYAGEFVGSLTSIMSF